MIKLDFAKVFGVITGSQQIGILSIFQFKLWRGGGFINGWFRQRRNIVIQIEFKTVGQGEFRRLQGVLGDWLIVEVEHIAAAVG